LWNTMQKTGACFLLKTTNTMIDFLEELLSGSAGSTGPTDFPFFNDENVEGYTSRSEWKASLVRQKKDKPYRIKHLKTAIDNMSLGRSLSGEPSLTKENGEELIWCRFSYGKTRQNLQILNECGMYAFIKDYATGRIRNVPPFDELVKSLNID
jgi:hypothetical protein